MIKISFSVETFQTTRCIYPTKTITFLRYTIIKNVLFTKTKNLNIFIHIETFTLLGL